MDSKLFEAISSGDYNKFLSLINANPSLLDQRTIQKNTVLHVAASYDQRTIVQEIIQRKPSILYATNSKEDTALHLAARLGRLEVLEYLIGCSATRQRDGDLEADGQYKELMRMVNWKEETALHDAVKNGHKEIVKVLVEKCPELVAKANKSGESPLFLAVERDYLDVGREILKAEIDHCSYGGREGANVLHAITIRTVKRHSNSLLSNSFLAIWNLVFQYLTHVHEDEIYGKKITQLTPTHKDFVVELLNKFPEIMSKADNHGWLPVHYAASLGSEEIVELILRKEPSMGYERDKDGMSALHIAAKEGHVEVLKTIVNLCPDSCEVLDVKDRTALHVAAANGNTNTVFVMLGMPVFTNIVNQEDVDGHTALHLAAIEGNSYLVRTLAADGRVANNMINSQGLTTHDIIGLSPKINFYGKFLSIKVLQRNGGLQGMHQVLDRKSIVIDDDVKNSVVVDEKKESVKISEVKTKVVGHQILSDYIGSEWSNTNLLLATIIAAASYSTTYQVPGGYDNNGIAVLQKQKDFISYMTLNALSFGLAVSSIFVTLLVGFAGGTKYFLPRRTATFMTLLSLFSLTSAYLPGIRSVIEGQYFSQTHEHMFIIVFEYPLFVLLALMVKLAFVRRRMWKKSIVK